MCDLLLKTLDISRISGVPATRFFPLLNLPMFGIPWRLPWFFRPRTGVRNGTSCPWMEAPACWSQPLGLGGAHRLGEITATEDTNKNTYWYCMCIYIYYIYIHTYIHWFIIHIILYIYIYMILFTYVWRFPESGGTPDSSKSWMTILVLKPMVLGFRISRWATIWMTLVPLCTAPMTSLESMI